MAYVLRREQAERVVTAGEVADLGALWAALDDELVADAPVVAVAGSDRARSIQAMLGAA